ncbi:MAG: hypothetical protein L3J86_04120, partial [Thermoplasmata archaeon]|nr:hypothetical protein [Thermoplasmata archaeon]
MSAPELERSAPIPPGSLAGEAAPEEELDAADLDLPGADPKGIAGEGDLQAEPLAVGAAERRDGQLPRVVVG